MARKNNNALFFTCSLIEYIGRTQKQRRWKVTDYLGMENIKRIYNYADVFHCEPIEKVAAEFTEQCDIPEGEFDNVSICRYAIPDYWDIGEVYERLIEDVYNETENTITFTNVSKNVLTAYDGGEKLSSETIEVECEVTQLPSTITNTYLTNIAYI